MNGFYAIGDESLLECIEDAKQGDPTAIWYSVVGLIERDRLAEAETFALQLDTLGFTDGCGVMAESAFSEGGAAPDEDRCLSFALRNANTDRPGWAISAQLAGKVFEKRGQIEQAITLYTRSIRARDAENGEAWMRLACIYLRPGPHQNAFKAAECLIGFVAADGDDPCIPGAPIEYDGAWVSKEAFQRLFQIAPPERRADLALLLLEGELLVPKGTWKREATWENSHAVKPVLNFVFEA